MGGIKTGKGCGRNSRGESGSKVNKGTGVSSKGNSITKIGNDGGQEGNVSFGNSNNKDLDAPIALFDEDENDG